MLNLGLQLIILFIVDFSIIIAFTTYIFTTYYLNHFLD